MIHRIIKASINGQLDDALLEKMKAAAETAADISSQTERKAQEMEREVEKMKKAEYMMNHIGEIFDGVISGVTSFGIYVELPNTVEGMVRLDSIKDDYYEYEEGKYRVIGRLSRKEYKLGDAVQIEVIGASPELRQIDFVLFDENEW